MLFCAFGSYFFIFTLQCQKTRNARPGALRVIDFDGWGRKGPKPYVTHCVPTLALSTSGKVGMFPLSALLQSSLAGNHIDLSQKKPQCGSFCNHYYNTGMNESKDETEGGMFRSPQRPEEMRIERFLFFDSASRRRRMSTRRHAQTGYPSDDLLNGCSREAWRPGAGDYFVRRSPPGGERRIGSVQAALCFGPTSNILRGVVPKV